MKKLERKKLLCDLLFSFYIKQIFYKRTNMLPFECAKAHVWGKFYHDLFYLFYKKVSQFF